MLAGFVLIMSRPPLIPVIVAGVLMIVVSLTSAIFTRNVGFSWALYLRSINQFIVPVLLVAAIPTKNDRDFVLRFLSWAPILCVVVGVIYDLIGRGTLFSQDYTLGVPRLQGSLNSAFLGGLALTGVFAAMQSAQHVSIRYLGVAAINLLVALLTAARMPIALTVALSATCFYLNFPNAGGLKIIGTVVGGLSAAVFLMIFGGPLITRFSSTTMSGREAMWEYLLAVLEAYRDFGVGYGHQQTIISHEVYIVINSLHAHNDYLRIAVELGFWPTIIFFCLWLFAMLAVWNHPRCGRNPIVLVGTITFAVLAFTDNAVSTSTHFPLLIIAAISGLAPVEVRKQTARSSQAHGRWRRRPKVVPARPTLTVKPSQTYLSARRNS